MEKSTRCCGLDVSENCFRAAGNRILAETTPTSTVSYLYPSVSLGTGGHECAGSGLPVGEQRDDELALSGAEGWLYYLPDAEGYVRQGADADGEVVSAWLFDPDGQGNHVLLQRGQPR